MSMPAAIERLADASEAQVRHFAREDERRARAEQEARDKARWERGYQSDLRKLTFATMLPAAPELALAFERIVPPEFWSIDRRAAIVACPCGHEPTMLEDVPTGCECTRTYVYTGEHVRVAGSPGREAVPS